MKRLKNFKTGFLWMFGGAMCFCILLYANDAVSTTVKDKLDAVLSNPSRFDYDLYYEIEAEKKTVEIQKGMDLQTLINALIAYTEGQYQHALESLTTVKESQYITRLVETQIDGGINSLIKACEISTGGGSNVSPIEECVQCSGIGIRTCATCRGLGKNEDRATQRQSVCLDCGGLGGRPCNHCRGYGISELLPLEPAVRDAAIEELILKAVYLKNSTVQ